MASTGIAAELLHEGTTVHKKLCRRRHVNSSTPIMLDEGSHFAKMLENMQGFIIDEISMQHRDVLEYVDRLIRAALPPNHFGKKLPFGGKVEI
jgi:hypothetical protein